MKKESFNENLDFSDSKVVTKVLLETSFSKEVRILMKQGQVIKEHKTHFPIIVHVLQGEIEFGVLGEVHDLKSGSLITLEGNVPHDLNAKEDSIVRLTLSKLDKVERIQKVAEESQ